MNPQAPRAEVMKFSGKHEMGRVQVQGEKIIQRREVSLDISVRGKM